MKAGNQGFAAGKVTTRPGQPTKATGACSSSKTRTTRAAAKAAASVEQGYVMQGSLASDLDSNMSQESKGVKAKKQTKTAVGEDVRAEGGLSVEDSRIVSKLRQTQAGKRVKVKKLKRKSKGGGQPPVKKAKLDSADTSSEAEDMKERRSKDGTGVYLPPHARHSTEEGAPVARRASNAGCCDEDDQKFHDGLKNMAINGDEKSLSTPVENESNESVLNQGRNSAAQLKVPSKKEKGNQPKVTMGTKADWEKHVQKKNNRSSNNEWECVQPVSSPLQSEKGRLSGGGTVDFGVRNTQTRMGRSRPSMETRGQRNAQFEEMKAKVAKLYAISDVMWIDSHCHLDFIYGKVATKTGMSNFEEWKVSPQFEPFFPKSFEGCIPNFIHPELYTRGLVDNPREYDLEWIEQQCKSEFVYGATYGCHPHKADLYNDKVHEQLTKFCQQKDVYKTVAIGECGLDFYRMRSTVDAQIKAFRAQLQLVIQFKLPLVIHCRPTQNTTDTEDGCLRIMKEVGLSRFQNIHRHCFTGNLATAKQWVEAFPNTYFGFTNTVVSFSAEQMDAAANISLDRILLETDAPYFRPKIFDCGDNDKTAFPGMAIATAKALAELRNESLGEVLKASRRNVDRCYSLASI